MLAFGLCFKPLGNRRWSVACAISSHYSDTFLNEVMRDDRLVARGTDYRRMLQQKAWDISALHPCVWKRLGDTGGDGTAAVELLHDVMSSVHAQGGYIHRKTWLPLLKYPFSLGVGDVAANLLELQRSPQPQEDTAAKVWRLLRRWTDHADIEDGVSFFHQIPFPRWQASSRTHT